jgi:glycosyltransferase involved in cell wall biosynthesis
MAPDLLVFRYWMPFMAPCLGSIAKIVRGNGKTKCIAITDNIHPHEKHFYDHTLTSYFTRRMDGFISMSQSVLNDLEPYAGTKPRYYIPHPMYDNFGAAISKAEAKKELGLNENEHYLLFFGFIRKYKGLDLLLEAMADDRFKNRNIKLIIAGEYYENPERYQDLIRTLDLNDRVIEKTDFIPNSEVYKYFSCADMVVQTYLEATQSGVTQVAYHFDKPMLVTDVGGLAELVPNGEVGYVVPKDPEKIASAILDFYDNQRENAFIDNIKIQKARFTWNALVDAIDLAAFGNN